MPSKLDANQTTSAAYADRSPCKHTDPDASLAAAVASKIEEGNLKTAIRLLSSEEKVAPCNQDTATRLRAKHPTAPAQADQPPDPSDYHPVTISEKTVYDALSSFPAGSSGGPCGLRPSHLIDLINCKQSSSDLLNAETGFINLLLDGVCLAKAQAVLFFGGGGGEADCSQQT